MSIPSFERDIVSVRGTIVNSNELAETGEFAPNLIPDNSDKKKLVLSQWSS